MEAPVKLSTVPDWRYSTIAWSMCDAERRAVVEDAYLSGELTWKLSPNQRGSYGIIENWAERADVDLAGDIFAFDCSRRYGKSAIEFLWLMKRCIKRKNARLLFIAPTWEQVKQYLFPIANTLLSDAPPHLNIHYKKSDRQYWVPWTNSHIQVIGLDRNPDSARGGAIDGCALDEAGFFDNLEYVINDVLRPQMLGRQWARVLAASTPSETPDHHWSETVVPQCEARGAHVRRTLDDADHYSPAERERHWNSMPGGRKGIKARREYGAEHIADETRVIFPEFTEACEELTLPGGKVVPSIVREVETPLFRDCYVAMDPGWSDMTGLLFAYWHFEKQALVIEDEICAAKKNTRRIARLIHRKEEALWKNSTTRSVTGGQRPQPYLRVSDNDHRLISDMQEEYGLSFIPTDKTDLELHVTKVRSALERREIIIHPRCEKLVKQMKRGVWKKRSGKGEVEFAAGGGQFGHYDLLAALVYLYRNVNKRRNPAPKFGRLIAGHIPDKRGAMPAGGSKWGRAGPSRWQRSGNVITIPTGRIHGHEKLDWEQDEDDGDAGRAEPVETG